jgi:hypothetical protein
MASQPAQAPWLEPDLISWAQWLLDSFRDWTGKELLSRQGSEAAQASALFSAPFVVVSHGMEEDPILNYGNQQALNLWEVTWAELTRTPSRLTAEPVNRVERERMLTRAAAQGYIDDYRGIRISRTGCRFLVEGATVWNVHDPQRRQQGQGATFTTWTFLDAGQHAPR